MSAQHHLPDEILLRYAAGECSEGESLLCACHLSLCAACREACRELEALGGSLLRREAAPPADAGPNLEGMLSAVLARLDAPGANPDDAALPPAPPCPVLPAPLVRYIGPLNALRWRTPVPGLKVVDLPVHHEGVPIRLKHMPPGMQIPTHGHRGPELELVLFGGATDGVSGERFERGDVAYNDVDVEHLLHIDEDGPCLSLGLHTGRVVPRGLWSQLVFGWLRW